MSLEEKLVTALREQGKKVTPQRRFIFQALEKESDHHPTAEEILRTVRETLPDVSLTTVYNTLHNLVEMDLIREVDLGEGMTRFDTNTDIHHHLLCKRCGKLVDIHRQFRNIFLPPEEAHGFIITSHQVIFEGICPDCQTKFSDIKH